MEVTAPQDFKKEHKKRRREVITIFFVSFLFALLTWFEIRLFATSQNLPFVHSIFFFGLVNFNIILLLLLLFLIFRNVVKVFLERQGGLFGSSLKVKLVAAFVSFSFVPTVLMFIISVFYINSSFDKWFSIKMAGVLKSSLEVTNAYYFNAKKKNYHFAHQIAEKIESTPSAQIPRRLLTLRKEFSLDAVEYYPSLFGDRVVVTSDEESIPPVPAVSLEFLQKGVKSDLEASTIYQFGEGNLVRVIVPVKSGQEKGAVVVSSFVPLSLIAKMNDVSVAYDEFRDLNPIQYPLKSIYLIILFLMTLVILLAATWFGFYLAKQLAVPLVQLGRATRRVVEGDYAKLQVTSGSEEITELIQSFNHMTSTLETSLSEIDQHTRYIEVVLKNVSAGVISVDKKGTVTTVNRHAAELLKIEAELYVGRPVRDLLTSEYLRVFYELLKNMQDNKVESLQQELRINVQGDAIPLQMNLSILKNDKGEEIGKIVVFDDMTPIVNAQRSAAWTEVARRIAHEIKNPLTPIKLSAERLQRKFGQSITDSAFQECTSMIIQQVDDLKTLVNEFSQFARLPQARLVEASLNQVISEAMTLYKQAHPQIEFIADLDPQLPDFKFDPQQIRRVLVNLIDNSAAALLSKPLAEKTSGAKELRLKISTAYDAEIKTVRLKVIDNGVGISARDRQRIFEPYFSTKQGGTGLGLAIVRRIIEDHNGFIRALPSEPTGTQMVIELPVHEVHWRKS
ncbi:MAG: sensor histidine kinase [Pseudobdellovibrionaceae bacterium]